MRSIMLGLTAILLTSGSAGAVDDWIGVVKLEAAYVNPSTPQVNITADVVYTKAGPAGLAWGTMSYLHTQTGTVPGLRVYAHAICVGKFAGNKWTVTGKVDQALGTFTPLPKYMTFELDVTNKKARFGNASTTEADARVSCRKQSGLFPAIFDHGYVIAY